MDVRIRSVIMLWLPLALLLWAGGALAKDKPKVHRHQFDFRVTDLQYFEDSETVLAHSIRTGDVRISHNAGADWASADGLPDASVYAIVMHPYDNERAYAIGAFERQWYTHDKGKSWKYFDVEKSLQPSSAALSFHAGDKDKIIFNTHSLVCVGALCVYKTFFTTNNFGDVKELKSGTAGGCVFARSQKEFKVKADSDSDLILCAVKDGEPSLISFSKERLLLSNDFFKTEEEPLLDGAQTMKGAFEIAAIKGYLLVAQRSEGTSELALYISDDGHQWDRAQFEGNHQIQENAYTVLESTDYSIQVLVKTLGNVDGMGTVLSSNSNGTYYRDNIEYVNRNRFGFVDFEKVQGIQGIYMVNTVSNFEDALNPLVSKKLKTQITFDDGRTFSDLQLIDDDGKKTGDRLHLHSVTGMSNSGRVYSSPAPGIVMGIGNTGDVLKEYNDGNMYVSDDAGLTWRLAKKEAHKYEFGDQGAVLVAIYDEGAIDKASYSVKHGREWEDFDLEKKIRPDILTTVPDSTSLKFILTGIEGSGSDTRFVVYFMDFEGLHERECGSGDFEDWVARKDKDGKPDCLMGHTQIYKRRKAEVDCFVNHEFKKAEPEEDPCPCTKEDFECDYNFRPDGEGQCQATDVLKPPKGACEKDDDKEKFKQTPYRLIPKNKCTKSDGIKLDEEEKEFECKATKAPSNPASGKISATAQELPGQKVMQKVYLERAATATGEDETVMILNDNYEVIMSRDQGKIWEKLNFEDPILGILPHPYNNDMVFFLTAAKRVHYSVNRGRTFDVMTVPEVPVRRPDVPALSFHVDEVNWMIWVGQEGPGHYKSWYSKDRGNQWSMLTQYCRKCEFIKRKEWEGQKELVFCEQYEGEDPSSSLQLVSSSDWFGSKPKEHFRDIVAFATMSDYIVVANKDDDQQLKIDASVDGQTFADARFPKDFNVPHSTAYTLLDSSTKAVFLQVTVSVSPGFEYGRLMKSNSNGTSYVSLVGAVNQNSNGYVDFEKMQGIAGVAMVNIVDNYKDEKATTKLLKTMITHNDGANWALIKKVKDNVGGGFGCSLGDDCSLHLHSYTERDDPRHTFASASAIGLMMGVGNVGKYLEEDGDTYITRDGGVEWHRVKEGRYLWEYGDQGSVIALVKEKAHTNMLSYTLDEGQSWTDYQFYDAKVDVSDLTTVPSDKSHSMVVWASDDAGKLLAISIDFDGLRSRTCELPANDGGRDEGDYMHWSPKHPEQDSDCLFGHETVLHRKKPDADCWNDLKIDPLHSELTQNCSCTRRDFECDYNYELTNDNTCALVAGLSSLDPVQICYDDPQRVSYNEQQGYRKIPISTCHGGELGRFLGAEHACPGHGSEFADRQPGLRGFGLFVVAFVLPVAAAAAIGYWAYQHWDGKFGRIRLGDPGSSSAWDAEQPWIRYPVAVAAAVVAVAAAVPMLLHAAWLQLRARIGGSRRYTTRASFARGRGEYAVVDPVEDELLGEVDEEF